VIRPLAIVAVSLFALVLWDGALEEAAFELRADRNRVGHLVSKTERDSMQIAGLKVRYADGTSFLFGRKEGLWRCFDFYDAVADFDAIRRLVDGFYLAAAVMHRVEPEELAAFGIGTTETIRVSLVGPNRGTLVAFDVGKKLAGRDATYVRRVGREEVWALEADVRTPLDTSDRTRPPLLEAALIPLAWPGWKSGVERILVDFSTSGYELEKRAVELTLEEVQKGRSPWVWILDPGQDEVPANNLHAQAFDLFLRLIPYLRIVDQAKDQDHEMEPAQVTVTLVPGDGPPLQLTIGRTNGNRPVPVWNPFTGNLYHIDHEVKTLVAPAVELFSQAGDSNPWDAYSRR